jgi:hypothetical protein
MKFILFLIFCVLIKQILTQISPNYVVKESNITFEFKENSVDINIYKNKTKINENITYLAKIQAKLVSIKEIFPNGLFYQIAIPKFRLFNLNNLYNEQNLIDSIRSDIIAEDILGYDKIIDKNSSINIAYKLFNESGWIDDNTNYIQKGNLFLETRVKNYPFCENLINEYNQKNLSSNNLDLNLYKNCKKNWIYDNSTKKYIEIPNLNQSKKNVSYLEFSYSFLSNDQTKFNYDLESGEITNQTEGNSYIRIYREIRTDEKVDYQLSGYPLLSAYPSVYEKQIYEKLIVRYNNFNQSAINWIFVDLEYKKSPPNFRNVSTILTFIIIAAIIIIIIAYMISRKKKKDELLKEDKNINLNNF